MSDKRGYVKSSELEASDLAFLAPELTSEAEGPVRAPARADGRWGYRFVKRAFDIAFSLVAIAVLLIPSIVLCAAIRLESPGNPLYSQKRVGRIGRDGQIRTFDMYKFRSMHKDADERLAELADLNEADGPLFKIKDDPRVTRIGKFIRKHSMASVIIGTPGAGEPTNSLSSAAKTSFDQQFYDRRPEVSPATQSIIPAPNSCLFTFFGGSRKAQYELEARADGADQGGSPWRGKASSSMIEKGAYCLTPALGVAA
ncbi:MULTISPECIES: sugar transferase [Eggerthella]|uniref:sugar transferase n=1 Tax=Eggerthella TaxID=84111 RepID=UPI001E63DC88|nr:MULTISPECIES: sugar transferase [Eggerthella]MDU5256799.1 sugar transferase [Eggerthella sp.]